MARLVKRPFFRHLMGLGIRLVVPKQRTGVAAVIFNQNDELLLLKHVFRSTVPWGLPGGWLERKESPADCAKRELREETGLTVTIGPPIKTEYQPAPDQIVIAYLGWADGEPTALSGEILEAKWVALDNLPDELFHFAREAIEQGYRLHCLLRENKQFV